jgi:FtsZ-binding cell division protein ZapB
VINQHGNVGIGTPFPDTRLRVVHLGAPFQGATAAFSHPGDRSFGHVLSLATDGVGTDGPRILFSYRNQAKTWSIGGGNFGSNDRFAITENTGDGNFGPFQWGQERLIVAPGGNVGVNRVDPGAKLHVTGGGTTTTTVTPITITSFDLFSSSNGSSVGSATSATSIFGPATVSFSFTAPAPGTLTFSLNSIGDGGFYGSAAPIIINANPDNCSFYSPSFGICPNFPLTIVNSNGTYSLSVPAGFQSYTFNVDPTPCTCLESVIFLSGITFEYTITTTTTTGDELALFEGGGNVTMGPAGTGAVGGEKLTVYGNVAWSGAGFSFSDQRYKTDIQKIDRANELLAQINGYTYQFNNDAYAHLNFPKTRVAGVLAQEIEQVLPEAVKTYADGYKAVHYDGLIPLLIEAIKEQKWVIDQQQQAYQALETRLQEERDQTKARLTRLESLLGQMAEE